MCLYVAAVLLLLAELTGGIVRCMGSDLTGHLAMDMGPELTSSIVHSSGIKNIGKLVAQMGGGITGEDSTDECLHGQSVMLFLLLVVVLVRFNVIIMCGCVRRYGWK